MNSNLYLAMAVAALAGTLASCSSDEPAVNPGTGANGRVAFTITAPTGTNSRAANDGNSCDYIKYAVYDADNGDVFLLQDSLDVTFTDHRTTVEIQLVTGKSYKVAFFAMNQAAPYTLTNGTLNVDYSGMTANNDLYDAFYNVTGAITVTEGMTQPSVTLTRPFAQVNVGASDWAAAKKAGLEVTQTAMDFSAEVPHTMNMLDGTVGTDLVAVNYALADIHDVTAGVPSTLTVASKDYSWVAMNYVLASATGSTVNTVTFDYGHTKPVEINSVPVRRNFRTNIVGNMFTSTVAYDIVIDNGFFGSTPVWGDDLASALANGGYVTLSSDLTISKTLRCTSTEPLVINLNGHSIVNTGTSAAIIVASGANVTIEGDGLVDGGSGGNNIAIQVNRNATLTINGGTYTVGPDASNQGNSCIETYGGDLIINDGYFRSDVAYNDFYYVLNQSNSKPGTITVNGGMFENYDPAGGDDYLKGTFIDSDHVSTAVTCNDGRTVYVVQTATAAKTEFYAGDDTNIVTYLKKAVSTKGSTLTLLDDVTYSGAAIKSSLGKAFTLDLNGCDLTFTAPTSGSYVMDIYGTTAILTGEGTIYNKTGLPLFYLDSSGKLTMEEGVNIVDTDNNYYPIMIKSTGTFTMNGGSIKTTAVTCVQTEAAKSTAYINGGYLEAQGVYEGKHWTLNMVSDKGVFVVKGGRFFNFDPSDTGTETDPALCNFVAEGYKVVSTASGTDIIYEVVPE